MMIRIMAMLLFCFMSLPAIATDDRICVHTMPAVPVVEQGTERGVSAAVMVQTGSVVYVAGGCNFPDQPAVEGGSKRYYRQILAWNGRKWQQAGNLRQPLAYGVAVPAPGGFIYVGGQNSNGSQATVDLYLLRQNASPVIRALSSLPHPIDNMAGVKAGNQIFIAGGIEAGYPSNSLYMLDLEQLEKGWQLRSEFPGQPRVQPVLTASKASGKLQLYIWGGFAAGSESTPASVSVDGLCYDVESNLWTLLPPPEDKRGKAVSLVGGTATVWNDSLMLFTGGVNRSVFLKALQREASFRGEKAVSLRRQYLSHQPEWYRFNSKLLLYNVKRNCWQEVSDAPELARAGAAAVRYKNELLVFQGELKPGIRSATSYRVQLLSPVYAPDVLSYVNPFIGTGGHGHTFPGPTVPNGMIQPGPDTRILGWDASSGYHYTDSLINGFSHTHLSGTGIGDYGDFLIMPVVGSKDIKMEGPADQHVSYASAFSHHHETASPGYYSVWLERYDVFAELTATHRAAIHRYTFPKSDSAGFVLDMDYTLQKHINTMMEVEVVNNTTIRGKKNTQGWALDQEIAFYAVFSKPFFCTILDDTVQVQTRQKTYPRKKVLLHFKTEAGEQVLVKLGISHVDMEGAQKNLETGIPDWNFDRVQREARELWRKHLSKIKIETGNKTQLEIFYTALYHTAIAPNLFSDADGRYKGMDKKIRMKNEQDVYTVFSLWDTFRALHPLLTIINPELNSAFIGSLLKKYDEGGILPMWELAANYTGTMIGYHAVPVIVDAYIKGDRSFDAEHALRACIRSATYDTTGILSSRYVRENGLMPLSKHYKNTLGYIPFDTETESVAKGLEYAYNDWCIARMAEKAGNTKVQQQFDKLALNYQYYFDSSTGFMRGKNASGNWRTPFHPRASNHRNDDYCEGTAWQWTWFIPHDTNGLQELMGGRKAFIRKLDSLFMADSSLEGDVVSADISGLIGQYAHGNEPSHHIIHLYNKAGQPFKTQELIDSVLQTLYHAEPDGLSGNEDCGQMSAWYVMNAMGFYQIAPGNPVYSIGRPLFNKVSIQLPDNRNFDIITKNNSRTNKYIKSARLNGTTLQSPFFTHQEVMKGGKLELIMSNVSTHWGVEDSCADLLPWQRKRIVQ